MRIEHTLFALPLALAGAILAARGLPDTRTLFLVAVAFAGGRTAAMAFNRLADRHLDAANPRTRDREIPLGQVSSRQAWMLIIVSCGLHFAAAWALNRVCFMLSPLVLAVLLAYSYTKRFSEVCHLFLGLCLGMAPVAGWLAVIPTFACTPVVLGVGVLFWVAGFDMIYSCQDVDFDRSRKLHSVPARLGLARALRLASLSHVTAMCLFVMTGIVAELNSVFYALSIITGGLLYWEHRLLHPEDLSRLDIAFFRVNSLVSFSLLISVWLGVS